MALCPFGKRGNRVTEECPGSRVRSGRAWVWAPLDSTREDSGSRAWTPRRRDPVWPGTDGSHSHPANDTSVRTCFHTHVSGGPGKKGRPPGSKLGSSHPPRPCWPPPPSPGPAAPSSWPQRRSWGWGRGLLTQQPALPEPAFPSRGRLASRLGLCTPLAGGLIKTPKGVSGRPGAPGIGNTLWAMDVSSGHVPGARQAPDSPSGLWPEHRGLSPSSSPPCHRTCPCALPPAGRDLPPLPPGTLPAAGPPGSPPSFLPQARGL